MVKVSFCAAFILYALFNVSLADINPSDFIPKGWQAGNGQGKTPVPYFVIANIDQDVEKEVILHCSYKNKGEYLPDKHIISILDWDGKKYAEKNRQCFDSMEEIFFLVEDINKDARKELVVHGLHSGNGAYGKLWVFHLGDWKPHELLAKEVQGEIYLWDTEKRVRALNHAFFPDLDKDGAVEILVGRREEGCSNDNHCEAEKPWWFDVYKWDGKTYVVANDEFPVFFKEQLKMFKTFVEEKGGCEVVNGFLAKAKKLAKE